MSNFESRISKLGLHAPVAKDEARATSGPGRMAGSPQVRAVGALPRGRSRITLSYMKKATVTIRLDAGLKRELDRLCRQLGQSRSEVAREALRRQIALLRFERSRRALLPLAEAQGILTDEDVFRTVS